MYQGTLAALIALGFLWPRAGLAQTGKPAEPSPPAQAPAGPPPREPRQPTMRPSTPPPSRPAPSAADTPATAGSETPATIQEPPADEAPAREAQEPSDQPQAPVLPPAAAATPGGAVPIWPQPGADVAQLRRQGDERPRAAQKRGQAQDVFAEDWWSHARPVLELHGYFRTRAELFHHFSLGRIDSPGRYLDARFTSALWPRPADNRFDDVRGPRGVGGNGPLICTESENGAGPDTSPKSAIYGCKNSTQAGANMRFRVNPELVISDNLRIASQIDFLDNVVLGSTPGGYANMPSANGGYQTVPRNPYNPVGFFDDTQAPPQAGINSLRNSILVKRVWAEYATPLGELRFGRMPQHWGLGMLFNSGDGYDHDYGSTIDRLQFTTAIKPLDLYVSGSWDFPNEGPTSELLSIVNAQPYDVAQLDDVDQYTLTIARRKSPELTRSSLARGEVVMNAGVYGSYRKQLLGSDVVGACFNRESRDLPGAPTLGCKPGDLGFTRRGAQAVTVDPWFQLLYRQFRFEIEAAGIWGKLENIATNDSPSTDSGDPGYKIEQYGVAAEVEQRFVEDRLRLGFNFGWSSGDAEIDGLAPGIQSPDQIRNNRVISTFRFNPSYQLDLILYRNILTRVQGTHYFRPSVQYDFMREPSGQKLGGQFAAIWSRATQFIQAPGHSSELGIELNLGLYFQSKDGAINDNPRQLGGFFTKLEYGVLFPMAGLGYPKGTAAYLNSLFSRTVTELNTPQILRWYLGAFF